MGRLQVTWIVLLVGCGPPSATPVRLGSTGVRESSTPNHVGASFTLRDTSDKSTVAAGSLRIAITDDSRAVSFTATPVCSGSVDVPASAFVEDNPSWLATTVVRLEPTCPPRGPDTFRAAVFTFTPAGGAALPPAMTQITPYNLPSLGGPRPPPTPTPTPNVVTPPTPPPPSMPLAGNEISVGGWPIALTVTGATVARDPQATPAFPDAQIVSTAACSVSVKRAPVYVVGGGTIQTRLARDGATFTINEVAPDHWRLEYRHPEHFGLNYGVVVGEWGFLCRGQYATATAQACASAICSTLRPLAQGASVTQ